MSLVELMIALIVLAVGILAVGRMFPTGARATAQDRLLIGANYYEQDFIQSGSGGAAVSLCAPKPGFPTRTPRSPCVPANATTFLNANNLLQNTDHIENTGFFGAASFDITETLTASIEGRWQKDKTVTAVLTTTPFEVEAKKFLPRAILRWMPAAETNLYASYSEGVLPTVINTQVVLATPREL